MKDTKQTVPAYYLKKLGKHGVFTIWRVDGNIVRSTIDVGFTNFGQHFRYPQISLHEFWIDREATRNEEKFYIDHMLEEWKLMKSGMSYKKALTLSDEKEKSERVKAGDLTKVLSKSNKVLLSEIRESKIGKAGPLTVYEVRGRYVRSALDIDFNAGGHNRVYKYVPKNDVWIDNDITVAERPYVILHELFEYGLMGEGLSYNEAHRRASRLEWRARHNEKLLHSELTKLNWHEKK